MTKYPVSLKSLYKPHFDFATAKPLNATFDVQQCGILTSVDSGEHVQPPFKLSDLQRL